MKIKITLEDNLQNIGKFLDELIVSLNSYGGKYSIDTEVKLTNEEIGK